MLDRCQLISAGADKAAKVAMSKQEALARAGICT
jgi:hypothetical protein